MAFFIRYSLCVLSLLALAGCSDWFTTAPKPKPHPQVSRAVQTEQYVTHLALLQLALAKEPADTDAEVKALNTYVTHNKKNKKTSSLTVAALEYKTKKGEEQTLLVPVPTMDGHTDFTSLRKVVQPLQGVSHTLQNIRTYVVKIMPSDVVDFSKGDNSTLRDQVKQQESQIMVGSSLLSVPENARVQLDMAKFFMQSGLRDAAYLALENAKEALAVMTETMPDQAQEASAMSKEAAALEENLHKEMPYKF